MVVKQDLLQDPPASDTVEHQTQTDTTDEPQTQETTLQDRIDKVLPHSVLHLHTFFKFLRSKQKVAIFSSVNHI